MIRLLALPGLLLKGLCKAFEWIVQQPWQAAVLLLLILWGVERNAHVRADVVAANNAAQARQWKADFHRQRSEMVKFKGMVRDARAEAARLDQANKARVTREWSAKLETVYGQVEDARAAARAAIERRMSGSPREGAEGFAGGCGAAELPALSTLPPGPLRPGEAAIISLSDALISGDNTMRLEGLIAAWDALSSIDVNGPPSAP